MLENIDLTRKVAKKDYKVAKDPLDIKLATLQRRAFDLKVPILIVFEGWDAAGKGTLINELILPLDPRGFSVDSTLPPTEEERLRPFLWRFWTKTPPRGRIAVFDRSWYRVLLNDRVDGDLKRTAVRRACRDILSFERQQSEDGTVIIKFFLHISKPEQKRRLDKLRKNRLTRWRVTREDLKRHRQYDAYLSATEEMLANTDSDFAPWTVVEARDHRFAVLKIFNTVISRLERRISVLEKGAGKKTTRAKPRGIPENLRISILERVPLSATLPVDTYRERLKKKQKRVRDLEHEIYLKRIPVVIVYEGWDAAGKGGNIRRLTQNLDPRGYEVVPIAAPNDIELAHHYLWRFWNEMPKAGHITIFDRSWYGRVMVERVEGFCAESDWRRAYREINEMEQHMVDFGTVVLKIWLHIDPEEQLKRFRSREQIAHKQWKITEEDWRNRKQHKAYKMAVEEMLFRTSTPAAPWTIVESNCKRYARIKTLDTVIKAIEKRLRK